MRRWRRTGGWTAAVAVPALLAVALTAGPASGQDELDRACAGYAAPGLVAECRLAAGAARVVQPRLVAALWGGNPIPGTANTRGMRIGSLPRFTVGVRTTLAPAELPPLIDRTASDGSTALLAGGSLDAAVGVLGGFSPLPTVGGVLSLDVLARLSYLPLRDARGFPDDVWGWWLGARVGLVRESFTLPGIAATFSFGRVSRVTFGDEDGSTDGFFAGSLTDLGAGVAASRRVGLVRLVAGARYDRMTSDLTVGFREAIGAAQLQAAGQAVHERWNGYINAGTTLLIFHGTVELGLQEAPTPEGLPAGVEVDPIGWYGGVAFRLSI